jgi:hypothetical protein
LLTDLFTVEFGRTRLLAVEGPVMKLELISLFLIFFSVIVIILGIIKIHTYPGKIAKARNHPQVEAIEVTSLLGLLIFPLWMAALVWAYSGAVVGSLYAREDRKEPEEPPVDEATGQGTTPGEPAGNATTPNPGD